MDLWVVAAVTGAGYLAKHWKNLSGESASSSGISIPLQSESIFSSTSGIDANFSTNTGNFGDLNFPLPPQFQGKESFQETAVGINRKSGVLDNSGDVLPEFETTRLTKSKALRSRWSPIKSLNSIESSLTESVFSSLPSPLTPTLRPLLVTDGKRVISSVGSDLCGVKDDDKEHRLKGKVGVLSEENSNTLLGIYSSGKIGSVELPRKPEQRHGKGRLSSSDTRFSGGPFRSQGSSNGMFLFFIGITIGIMSAVISNKREVDNLNELLKKSDDLVRDLHEELEMKDMLTLKELAGDYNQSQETIDCTSCNWETIASSSKQQSEECTKHNEKELDDEKVENHEMMSKIEAELEAELERLELNMKASTMERISDFVELDPDLEADVIQGDLKVDLMQPGGVQSESDSNTSGTFTNHTHTANYAVSPRELSLRLHEVIESRLKARIMELEAALQNSQNKVHSLEWQRLVSPRGLACGKVGSTSTPGSPIFANEVPDVDRPFVINLSGEALDAYNEAYEEIIWVRDTDEDTPDAVCGSNRFTEQRSRSLKSNEDDDEFLIRQIVEKSRQGCSLVFNVN
ncbi:DNA double-strand break repair Rad50 ATPase [Actinidia chinensis var. chinensis]|uniref:DNA double-strand break repair Rad50 ATPase n=1 Tax=Actinidia chinensis var. chinensis TaxID=1590841 RepID=A0A2R6QQX3_ACTCC|nr:DNA double-strand break repair Rad50 ATPase [Actinidia chinensis var. chinensis]